MDRSSRPPVRSRTPATQLEPKLTDRRGSTAQTAGVPLRAGFSLTVGLHLGARSDGATQPGPRASPLTGAVQSPERCIPPPMRSTKIVATIGPASQDPAVLEQMIRAGMDVARLNFAHGSGEEHAETVAKIRAAA